jgi:alkylation response protein AidB-like acyl-CoA dehydrogenase
MTWPADSVDARAPGSPQSSRHATEAVPTAGSDARALWLSLGSAGVLRSLQRESAQSLWIDPAGLAELLAELDARYPPGPVLSVCVQVATVIPLLRSCAPVSPRAGLLLERMLRGEAMVALAATDAGLSGSALLDLRTEVLDTADGVSVHGGKEWISNAGHCDEALVLARCRPARHFTSYSWVLVPADHPDVSFRAAAEGLLAGSGLGHLSFEDVRLERDRVIGRPGRALAELTRQLGAERLAGALWARTLCRRVLLDTHRHLRARSTGTGVLWDNAAVRERFARCLVELCQLDALCRAGCSTPITVAQGMALKASFAVVADRILGECLNLRGAGAFADDGLARMREQYAMFAIAGGTTATMLAGIADHAEEMLRAVG